MIALVRYGVWWMVPVLLLGWVMSLGCATAGFLGSRSGPPPWDPTQEIATGTSQVYITGVEPLVGGGRRYAIVLHGLLRQRPSDRDFTFTVDEVPGQISEISLTEPTTPAAPATRGQPLQIWNPGLAEHLTSQHGAPEQVLVDRMTWRDGEVTFILMWRTPEGELHSGALHVTPRPEHRETLNRICSGVVFVPALVGCMAVDAVIIAAAIPVAIIVVPVALGASR